MPEFVWTAARKRFVAENAAVLHDQTVAERLSAITGQHVSLSMVRTVRQRMGIKKARGGGKCEVLSRAAPRKPDEPEVS